MSVATVREQLVEHRRRGEGFPEAWRAALDGLSPEEAGEWRAALEGTAAAWKAAYQDRPATRASQTAKSTNGSSGLVALDLVVQITSGFRGVRRSHYVVDDPTNRNEAA